MDVDCKAAVPLHHEYSRRDESPSPPFRGRGRGPSRRVGRVRWVAPQKARRPPSPCPSPPGRRKGCPRKLFSQEQRVIDTHITPKSSCADLIRASTPFFRPLEGVDAHGSSPWAEGPRDKPGQDEVIRPISSLVRPQNFPRTALRPGGREKDPSEFNSVGLLTPVLAR
jgi:hypothetical protein